ncbi:eukaryotic translation initiation factor 4E isoform 1 [Tropilaelaps mercedesae]|uniref:Eukaryotic translation initiation factor 4E isoform 1 n=1 Tax=Tropilaelaps mercedesae TaxID=418985 RepID=A0A1V9XIG7_9ACAR|nr:eukaryotic translation initiation factor 4E isoform 1 [Tropilaelaps mercedesae]
MAKNKKGKKNNKQARNVMKPAPDAGASPRDAVKVTVADQTGSGDAKPAVAAVKSPAMPNPAPQPKENTSEDCVKPPEVDSGRDSPESASAEVEEDAPTSSAVDMASCSSPSNASATPVRDEQKPVSAKGENSLSQEANNEPKKSQMAPPYAEKESPASACGGLAVKSAPPSAAKCHPYILADDAIDGSRGPNESNTIVSTPSAAADIGAGSPAKSKKRRVPQLSLSKYKHQLEFEWSFWFSNPWLPWENALTHVQDFAYIEDFWSLFNNLKVPSEVKYSYYLFKKGIRPEWEDPVNELGGKWVLTHGKASPDQLWQELVLLFIGGAALDDLSAHITGIYFAHKRTYVCQVSVWLDTTDRVIVKRIGDIIRTTLQTYLHCDIEMDFATHGKQMQGSKKKGFRQPNQMHSAGVTTF